MKKYIFLLILSLLGANCLWSQGGTLDSTFGENGVLFFEEKLQIPTSGILTAVDNFHRTIVAQSDDADSSLVMVRFLEEGTVDQTFGQSGEEVLEIGMPFTIRSMAIQNDNGILVLGDFRDPLDTVWDNRSDIFLVKFLENGQPDPSFGFQGMVTIEVDTNTVGLDLAVQDDGKILVTGRLGIAGWGGGSWDVFLLRLLSDGTLDPSFGNAGVVVTDLSTNNLDIDIGEKIVIQPDEKILVSGRNGNQFGGGALALIRYQANGSLDTSFGNGGISIYSAINPRYSDILLYNDGSILVAGSEGDVFYGGRYATLRRFKPDGAVDSMFAENGIFKSEKHDNGRTFFDIDFQADNKIVAAGFWGDGGPGNALLMRFYPDGRPDSTFGTNARALLDLGNCIGRFNYLWFSPDQKITALGICQLNSVPWLFSARFNNDLSNSINNPTVEEGLIVFPNPANEHLIFRFENMVGGTLTLSRSDGTVISTANLHNEQQHEFSVAGLSDGVYYWTWMSENPSQMTAGKFMVLH